MERTTQQDYEKATQFIKSKTTVKVRNQGTQSLSMSEIYKQMSDDLERLRYELLQSQIAQKRAEKEQKSMSSQYGSLNDRIRELDEKLRAMHSLRERLNEECLELKR